MTPTTPVTSLFADLIPPGRSSGPAASFGATKMSTPLPDLADLARVLGGEVQGNQILAPGPGHRAIDRSMSVKLDSAAPDGFLVHSFANDDPVACRDYIREKCGIPAFKPNGRPRATRSELDALFAS